MNWFIHFFIFAAILLSGSASGTYKPAQNLQKTAYDELHVESENIFVSGNAVYGFIPSNFRTFLEGAGTATTSENLFKVTSGTALADYGVIRSFRSVNFKTGQGATIRFSGYFESPQALTWSGMGGFNVGDELSFGYNGLVFGVWHRYGGIAETRTIQITLAAAGSGTATLTLNDVEYVVPIVAGTVQSVASQIALYLKANATELGAEQLDDSVVIDYLSDGPKTGTFSYSSTTSATGTITQNRAGVTKTSIHTPYESFNTSSISGFNPELGNNYMIRYSNGFGDAEFYIQDSVTSQYKLVHVMRWANTTTVTNLTNPSLRVGVYATSIGATTATNVYMAYIGGFISGKNLKTRNPRSFNASKSIGTTTTNILTIRNNRTFNLRANQVEIEPDLLTISNDGVKTAVFTIRTNATVAGTPNFQTVGNNLVTSSDIAGTTVTNGTIIASFVVGAGQSEIIDLTPYNIRVPPDLTITISGRFISGASNDLTASLAWYEDI